MRRVMFIAVGIGFAFVALAARSSKPDAESDRAQIRLLLEKYANALESEDLEQLLQVFVQDEDLVTVNVATPGLELGPSRVKTAAKSWFDAVKDIDVTVKKEVIKVNRACNAAWVSFTLDGSHAYPDRQGRYDYEGMRVTWGLEKRKGQYLVVQAHWSFMLNERRD